MIPINVNGIVFGALAILVSLSFLILVALAYLISARFRSLVKRRRGVFFLAISPFLYVAIKLVIVKIDHYYWVKEQEQVQNKLQEYSTKYTTLAKEDTVLGITFPKGTKFSRWYIRSNEVLFHEATFPTPFNFNGIYITRLGFEHGNLVTVSIFENQEIEGFMCTHLGTLALKNDGAVELSSCHLAENPVSQRVTLDDFHGSIRRKSPTLKGDTHTWELSGRGRVNGTEFYNYGFYLDEKRDILSFYGYLIKLPKYTDGRSRGMLVETYDRDEILKLKANALR